MGEEPDKVDEELIDFITDCNRKMLKQQEIQAKLYCFDFFNDCPQIGGPIVWQNLTDNSPVEESPEKEYSK